MQPEPFNKAFDHEGISTGKGYKNSKDGVISLPVLKILQLILGLLSFAFSWMTLEITISIYWYSITVIADYNFLGFLTRISVGDFTGGISELSKEWEINDFTLFGVFFLLGFIVSLFHVKTRETENNKGLGILGAILMGIGLFGYLFVAILNIQEISRQLIQELSGTSVEASISYSFGGGFYCGLISLIILFASILLPNPYCILINTHQSANSTGIPATPSIASGLPPDSLPQSQSRLTYFCPNCGKKVRFTQGFCHECGAKLPFKGQHLNQ